MKALFDPDSPIMRFLALLADLMLLELLMLICCLPVVTGGAALSAMHYILLKMVRDEEGHIIRPFFKAFKDNLKQGTLLWLLFLAAGFLFVWDFYLVRTQPEVFPGPMKYLLTGLGFMLLMIFVWVFPLQSHFYNPASMTLKNALILAVGRFPRTLGMAAVTVLPFVILLFVPAVIPLLMMFWLSGTGYVCALLYDPVFRSFEPEEEGEELSGEESGEED